jgi:phage head maturation protease
VVEPQLHGLFIAADLGSTSLSRQMFEDIDAKLITRMSWAFMPVWDSIEDVYDEESKTLTSTIHEVERVYDVSAVSLPADPNTEISARSYFDGAIERIAAERLQSVLEAQKAIELRRKRMELRAKSMQLRH